MKKGSVPFYVSIGTTIIIALVAFTFTRVQGQVDEHGKDISSLKTDVAALKTDVPYIKESVTRIEGYLKDKK